MINLKRINYCMKIFWAIFVCVVLNSAFSGCSSPEFFANGWKDTSLVPFYPEKIFISSNFKNKELRINTENSALNKLSSLNLNCNSSFSKYGFEKKINEKLIFQSLEENQYSAFLVITFEGMNLKCITKSGKIYQKFEKKLVDFNSYKDAEEIDRIVIFDATLYVSGFPSSVWVYTIKIENCFDNAETINLLTDAILHSLLKDKIFLEK